MTRTQAQAVSAFDAWDTDVAETYLRDYYQDVEPDEVETIRFVVDSLRQAESNVPILVFGSGPTLHHVFPAAQYASEIHIVDYLASNLDHVQGWLDGSPSAHDWSPFVRYALGCEGVVDPTEVDVARREALVRDTVTLVGRADAGLDDPLGPGRRRSYPTIVNCYCADSATSSKTVWRAYMRHICSLLAPGGLMITAALRCTSSYVVGDKRFPSANIDEGDMRRCLEDDLGLERVTVEPRRTPGLDALGYSGILLALGRLPLSNRR